jgi:predicted Zn finger-like uncharacterized protein
MYTRCPSCSSTFRVTAALLQMAEGDVRCGSCGAVFNALHTLVDDWTGTFGPMPSPVVPADGPDAVPQDRPEAPGAEASFDDAPAGETLEFDAPERDWQRFFIAPEEARPVEGRADPALGEDFAAGEPEPARSLEEETADTDTWKAFLREAAPVETADEPAEDEDSAPPFVILDDDSRGPAVEILVRRETTTGEAVLVTGPEPDAPGEPRPEAEPESEPESEQTAEHLAPSAGDSEPAPRETRMAPDTVLDWGPPPAFSKAEPRGDSHTGRWLAASAVAALLLAVQALHHYRDALAADPRYGALVRDAYARLGQSVYPDWPLEAYEIRSAKAEIQNSTPGALDIVADIAVTGTQPVGLPMVRVILRDRWTNPVASGIFDSSQYLAEAPSASRAYSPGTLIPVAISLKDPGSAAQGYELDVCLPNRRFGLQCQSARDPFRR